MGGLVRSDARLTIKALRHLPDDHQGLMRCALNGTQYTHDALCHAGVVDTDQCRFCSSRDSLYHRTWECPFFQDLRDGLGLTPEAHAYEQCTLCHGWLPRSPDLHRLKQKFLDLPDTTAGFCLPPAEPKSEIYRPVFGWQLHPPDWPRPAHCQLGVCHLGWPKLPIGRQGSCTRLETSKSASRDHGCHSRLEVLHWQPQAV